jgi:hypothetical protein
LPESIVDNWHDAFWVAELGLFNPCFVEHPDLVKQVQQTWFSHHSKMTANAVKIVFAKVPWHNWNMSSERWSLIKHGRRCIKTSVQIQLHGWHAERVVHQCPMIVTSTFPQLVQALQRSLRQGRHKLLALALDSPQSSVYRMWHHHPLCESHVLRIILAF